MCGRYASSRSPGDLVLEFEVDENHLEEAAEAADEKADEQADDGAGEADRPAARYNIAPTDTVPVVLERLVKSDGTAGTPAVRQLRPLTWGLVPAWSKDRTAAARMINARVESLLEKPAFKKAALTRRCLIPADGWYEWQVSSSAIDRKGKPRKQPFFLHPADGTGLAFAGIYEFWRDSSRTAADPQAWLVTFAVITTVAEPGLEVIHDRMPLVLPADRWDDWLDPHLQAADGVRALIEPPPPGRFVALPVTTRVNSVRNDGPELLEPAPAEELVGVVIPSA